MHTIESSDSRFERQQELVPAGDSSREHRLRVAHVSNGSKSWFQRTVWPHRKQLSSALAPSDDRWRCN